MNKTAVAVATVAGIVGVLFLVSKAGAEPVRLGDLDNDGVLTEADITILEKYILGFPIEDISPLPEEEFLYRADVNQDGVINMGDAVALERLILGV